MLNSIFFFFCCFDLKGRQDNTEESDNRLVSEIAESLKLNMKLECQRIGKQNTEGKQLLRIKCETEKMKKYLLKKAKSLKENERFKYFFIQPDLTKTERENRKKMVAELKEKGLRNPSTHFQN